MAIWSSRLVRTIIYILVGLVIVGFIYTRFFQQKKDSSYVTAKAEKGSVHQSVALTGTAEPLSRYDLQFPKIGKIKNIFVKVGDKVKTGNLLASIENTDSTYQLEAQKAVLRIAQANLAKASAGPRQEEVNLNTLKIQQAENALSFAIENAQRNSDLNHYQLNNAEIAAQQSNDTFSYTMVQENQNLNQNQQGFTIPAQNMLNAFQNALQSVDKILGVTRPSVLGASFNLLGGGNIFQIQNARNLYNTASQNISTYQNSVQNLPYQPTLNQIDDINLKSQNAQTAIHNVLMATQDLLNNTQTDINFTEAQLSALKQDINANFGSVQQSYQALNQSYQNIKNNQIKAIQDGSTIQNDMKVKENGQNITALQGEIAQINSNKAIQDAQTAIDQAKEQLNLLLAEPRNVDLQPLQGQVDQAWQNVHLAEYQLAQTQLKAPADGIITAINSDIGETVISSQPFMTLDTTSYYIKALISEADISKIQKGQSVVMTFDAFDVSKEFKGMVTQISPAETVVQGVIYYEVKIQFDPAGAAVKPGMTANLTIQTQEKSDTLVVPNRAVQYDGNQAYVQVLKQDSNAKEVVEKRNVNTGLQGDENIEIISGLQEGEDVITFTKTT